MTAFPLLVQLSDTHVVAPGLQLLGQVDTPALLRQAVRSVQRLQPAPSAVIVTGDLVDRGSAAEYHHLREILAPLTCPVWLMPGNHDATPELRLAFPEHHYLQPMTGRDELSPFVLYAQALDGWRVVALDTVVQGASHGALCAARLRWLDELLAQSPDVPTVIAMHHPPFRTGIEHMDEMGLREGADELEAVIRRHRQVQRVICGHLHRSIVRGFAGTVAMTVPSTAHQITMDLRKGGPAAYLMEPPGFGVHLLIDGQVVSHSAPSGDFGPASLF
jgi:3',5'-cyclic AMP phosphodiesterase CpdA